MVILERYRATGFFVAFKMAGWRISIYSYATIIILYVATFLMGKKAVKGKVIFQDFIMFETCSDKLFSS